MSSVAAERCRIFASTTTSIVRVAQQRFGVGNIFMNVCGVEALSLVRRRGDVVVSMADLSRVFASTYNLVMGSWKWAVATSEAWAQGAIFVFASEPAMVMAGAQGSIFTLSLC
jgi:hypothetical protein